MRAFFRPTFRSPFAYAAALAFAGLALILAWWVPVPSPQLALLIFAAAVVASGAAGGLGPVLVSAVAGLLCVVYFFIPVAGSWKLPSTLADAAAFVGYFAISAAAAWVSRMAHAAAGMQARADEAAENLRREARRREALLTLNARAMAGGRIEAIGREALSITIEELDVDYCAVLELTPDQSLTVADAAGWEAGVVEGLIIPADVDTQAGYALHAREPVIVGNTDADTRLPLPTVLRERGARSGMAARIAAAGQPFGVIVAYHASPRRYAAEDAQFLAGVAAVLGGLYERRRVDAERAELLKRDAAHRTVAELASRRSAFLAQTATVLDAALDPETTLVSLARLAVPALADCAIVDLVQDEGRVRRVDVVDIDPLKRDAAQSLRRLAPHIAGEGPFARAIRTGQSVLLSEVPDDGTGSAADAEGQRLMKTLQCPSLLLIPLVARGQTLGLITLASRTRDRRYGAEDLIVAQELAARAAIALDNARLYREAQAASKAKDAFLATVSHELRTPVNAVLGWATLLRQHNLEGARAEHACEAIERSARAQAQLLEQLLDVSRIISGKLDLHLAPVRVSAIIEAAVDAVRPAGDDKSVRFATRFDHGLPALMLDGQRLQQVVINLLSNAVKFSGENATVQVELQRDGNFAEIVVKDRGIGIRREFLPYVFDRLRQGDAGRANGREGLGLGLSIVRDIVERHGGTVSAHSDGEGKGSTFVVRLPMRSVVEPAVAAG